MNNKCLRGHLFYSIFLYDLYTFVYFYQISPKKVYNFKDYLLILQRQVLNKQ